MQKLVVALCLGSASAFNFGKKKAAAAPARTSSGGSNPSVALRAIPEPRGAFTMRVLCAQRRAGVLLNISATFWRISSPD